MKKDQIAQLHKGVMKRVLGVKDLFAVGYGDLGSSIYYALGITAFYALGATPIALGLAGSVFICTALTYAEITSSFHESGGSASFTRHAFNDLVSFIAGWGLLLDYIVTIAISAFAVGGYLSYFHPDLMIASVQIGFAVSLIFILFLLNLIGIRESTRISLILALFTLITQAIIIFIGLVTLLDLPLILDHMRINVSGENWSPDWMGFWKGTAMAMVAYTGIESIAQLGAEAKRPGKTGPRAVMLTMVVIIFMYLGITLISLSALSPELLGTKYVNNPLSGVVAQLPIGSKILAPWIGILAATLLFLAANAGVVGSSRLAFNMGEYYQLPRFFYKLHSKFRTPYVSLLFFTIIASLIVFWSRGNIDFLADLYNFGAMIAFFFAHLSLIVMRVKKPELKRPFRVPFNIRIRGYQIPITAVIGALVCFGVWVLLILTKPEGRYLGCAWMILGTAMYLFYRKSEKISATGQLEITQVKVPGFKPLLIKHILVLAEGGENTETVQMACELSKLHRADLTAVHILKIPSSLPLDTHLPERVLLGEAVLKRAEAIARELNIEIDLQMVRSRSISDALLEILRKKKHDLLILEAIGDAYGGAHKIMGKLVNKILRESSCRLWFCCKDSK
jgi:basic amino acid/polyamine antiporter, APA family